MKKQFNNLVLTLILVTGISMASQGIDTRDTRMMNQPAISANHLAFIYANDLWIANADGTFPRRLTSDDGVESLPYFSPDGKTLLFSAEYDGNMDLFSVPVEGGIPTRLTWHPGSDGARGFTQDGKSAVFVSSREDYSNRYAYLYTVPLTGGFPQRVALPNAFKGSWSPDGKAIAYNPIPPRWQQWKNYRGGTVSTIWIYNFTDQTTVKVPQPEGRCNDIDPMWVDNKIYFASDRNGEFNLFSYDPASKAVSQLTSYKEFPVINPSFGAGKIIFEQSGYLYTYEIASKKTTKLTLAIAADLTELRPRFAKGPQFIWNANISPTGARAVFEFRGEILTAPAEKGDPRNITETPGSNERSPAWSPDGKSIAFFSDASGEYKLEIKPQDGKSAAKSYTLPGTGFYAHPIWSPDGKYITFVDNGRNLWLFDTAKGESKKVDSDDIYVPGPYRNLMGDWSSDSKWLVYTKVTPTQFKRVYLYSLAEGKSYPLTDGLSDANNPVFDPGGKYIYFMASTDAGPVLNWFDLSNADMRMTSSIYLITLSKTATSPFAKESDEEVAKEESKSKEKSKEDGKSAEGEKAKVQDNGKDAAKGTNGDKEGEKNLKIDLEGIQQRIVAFPLKAGNYGQMESAKEGEILYVVNASGPGTSSKLFRYDMKERKESEVMELDAFELSADGKKMIYIKGTTFGIADAGKKPEPGKGIINTQAFEVKIDPAAEWKQIFDEVWRINRDYFYDPGMHGANWAAMKKRYAPFLDDLSCRNDLNRVIQWLGSELSVGHSYSGGGDQLNNPARVGGGLLGADYEISNNRYRFKKIYGGLNWNPSLKAPLTEPGINARQGEYLLAINGKNITADVNLYSYFENTAGKIVELTIGPNPDTTGSRIVKVEPVSNEASLRNRDWVEGNLKKVTEATNGRVAYVYVPNTATAGHEYFKRYFYPQADRDAIIVDERFNGGGSIADYYIDLLTRPYQSSWKMRYGRDLKTPSASIQGPKVMIIDETAGSGGDMLPWMFRKFKVGTLVGKRTWGGLVGILGFPPLMDGGFITAPNVAIWTNDGYIVENEGVHPDIEVEMWPADVLKGRDPQLEKAIEVALDELKKNPPVKPVAPPFPVRVKK